MQKLSFLMVVIAIVLLIFLPAIADNGFVRVITLDDDIINPVTSEYISQAIADSGKEGAECLIIQLDTPGGLLASTRTIVKELLNANIPVVVYVAPSGARAGSAGVFITLAANVAAMAPSTNIGAAHPVELGGESEGWREAIKELEEKMRQMERRQKEEKPKEERPEDQPKEEPPEEEKEPSTGTTMGDKVLKDTVAWTRGIARVRGRNEEWAVKAVTESLSITETEALEKNVIDLVCKDIPELLDKIDGREVELPTGMVTLETKGARIEYREMTARQKILKTISNPNIAYILMMLGFFGLLFEVTHTGAIFPGVAGAICLIIAFYSFQTLPVNYAGLLLIILAIILFIAEAKVTSYGLLTIGGLISMTLGSIMLIDSPYEFLRVSNAVIFPVVFSTAAIVVFLVTLIIRAHSRKSVVGEEGLVGLIGTAETDIAPEGKVFVHGEIWNARSTNPINRGSRVKVVTVDGMTVVVETASES
ncbi:MAG: nodulation protein NfeD [Candidatus Abyssobacteria bacterium SURF_17]|jgi:membrane-bound serine protease (ClpP class)|uniref:Nodulation protein NfeD n=1 Tax=Candidatus Abyssobacteria bacterium SURF_17 TaxID=2093361 RepID=A0A419EUN7_9BACT|nr:MAG: nodulation protein NfeD [Candidatus Abyssubacteria bacterium SURF_17]